MDGATRTLALLLTRMEMQCSQERGNNEALNLLCDRVHFLFMVPLSMSIYFVTG